MSTVIRKREIIVPVGAMVDVCDIIINNRLSHQIIATDEDEETITLEFSYEPNERSVLHEIEDLIADYEEEEEEEDEDDEDDEEDEDNYEIRKRA